MNRACYALGHLGSASGQALSRFVNAAFLRGSIHQSVSARAYQMSFSSDDWSKWRARIDAVLGDGHCKDAWDYEVDNALKTLERNGMIPKI